jgi:hypothetical protein
MPQNGKHDFNDIGGEAPRDLEPPSPEEANRFACTVLANTIAAILDGRVQVVGFSRGQIASPLMQVDPVTGKGVPIPKGEQLVLEYDFSEAFKEMMRSKIKPAGK